jgi:hypothetical protein
MSPARIPWLLWFSLSLAIMGSSWWGCLAQVAPPYTSAPAVYDLDRDRDLTVPLEGSWRRQIGDDPVWADPNFDDSKWPLVSPMQPWSEQRFSGMAWFRVRVRVPANAGPLSLYVSRILSSFQIFANGQLVTSAGGMPPHPHPLLYPSLMYPLPAAPNSEPYTLTLAIRVWHWPIWADYEPGGPYPNLRIGRSALIQKTLDTRVLRASWLSVHAILLAILEGLAGLTALTLFLFRRKESELFWFAIYLLGSAVNRCFQTWTVFHAIGPNENDLVLNLFEVVSIFSQIGLYYRLLEGKRSWLFWGAIGSGASLILLIVPEYQNRLNTTALNIVFTVLSVPLTVWILTLLLRRAQQGFPDARLLLVPVLLSKIVILIGLTYWIAFTANWNIGSDAWVSHTLSWPFDLSLSDLADVLFLVGMLAILIRRFTRTQRHEETYERERAAARIVQQLLIPADLPPTPGYQIATVYEPASEVSGDFFQVIPLETGLRRGSILIAVGDVSGKGLPAALMVSLLVGTLRTYAETLVSPAEILAGLNRRVNGRTGGGFTTCLVLRADADGTFTLASAGHIAPYLDGVELIVDNGLPLGLSAESSYTEASFELPAGHQLTILTDGVVEARNANGDLFGFEHTQEISKRTAGQIALAAQLFGQDDDTTVLTLARIAEPIGL